MRSRKPDADKLHARFEVAGEVCKDRSQPNPLIVAHGWEQEFIRSRIFPIVRGLIASFVGVHPVENAGEYYRALLSAIGASLLKGEPVEPSHFLRREVWVSRKGLEYLLTKDTVFGYYLHIFEPKTAAYMLSIRGTLYIDVGANVGQYVVPLAKNFAHVVAVEPNPVAVDVLEKNLARNRLTNVKILRAAVSPQGGPLEIHSGAFLTTWGVHAQGPVKVRSSSLTLDQILSEFDYVDLLKLDIEGLELPVLESSKLLNRVRWVSVAAVPQQANRIAEVFRRHGMSLVRISRKWSRDENAFATRVT